jgi:hypothetical protein
VKSFDVDHELDNFVYWSSSCLLNFSGPISGIFCSIDQPDAWYRRLLTATFFPVIFLQFAAHLPADRKDLVSWIFVVKQITCHTNLELTIGLQHL